MQGLDTLKSVGGNFGGSLSEKIPQAVSQAITPLIQSTAKDINAELVGNGSSALVGVSPQPIGLPFRPGYNAGGFESLLRQPPSLDFTGSFSRIEPAIGPAVQLPMMYAKGGKTEARAVQSQGRGEDTMLVHMTPGEVAGLQALAVQHGGSLTINPETGLPEAGFLKSLLPTLIGAGLTIFSGGAINPLTAGFLVGGIEAARTGDIGKGLMAGLGAYGGGSLTTAAAAAAPATNVTAGGAATGLTAGQAGAVTPTLSNVGAGLSNLASSGAAGEAARQSAMASLGGGTGLAAKTGAAFIEPLTAVPPVPEVAQPEYNYDGPYKPTERKVRFPTADRDPMDSSEFQYFDVVNPAPGFEPIASSAPLPQNTYGPDAPRFAGIPVEMATDPARMRDYQQNPQLYSFSKGGVSDAPATAPPEGYQAGMQAEFDYGFRPMAAQVPEIQQEAAVYNPVARERYGFTTGGDGPQTPSTGSTDMGYIPGIAAGIGRTYNDLSGLAKAVIPGAMMVGGAADANMRERGYEYNPLTRDYEQRDYMDGGSAGYSTRSGSDGGGRDYDSYSDAGKAASDRGDTFFRAGGMTMDNGGFVIDAHTVSEVGNGSSDAGHSVLASIGGEPIKGPGDGTSDSIRANIGGVQEARIARDESYLSRDDVKALGGGDVKKGEKKLYALMKKAHDARKKSARGKASGLDKLVRQMATA